MNAPLVTAPLPDPPLRIAGRDYRSRLLVGTGKYKDFAETRAAVAASGAEIVTVAVRTLQLARELLDGHKLAKLEVLGDKDTLYPDVRQTLRAAETLVKDGFD